MKTLNISENKIRKEIITSMIAVIVLLGGSITPAEQLGKMELKKDEAATKNPPMQTQQQTLDPFQDMLQLHRDMDQLFGNMLNPYSQFPEFDSFFNEQPFQQAMDLRERPDAFVVEMDLPGMEKSDITVEAENNILRIHAERRSSMEQKADEKIIKQERNLSAFSREIVLPATIKTDEVNAEYKAGVLTITLPKAEPKKAARKIKIN